MKVLLIGGTGVISSDVCDYASGKGLEVYVLNRGKRAKISNSNIKSIVADVKKESIESLKSKLQEIKFDVVVDFLSYDVVQLRKMFACVRCTQYIFVSSATVYDAQPGFHIYSENDPKGNRGWSYCSNKYDCELELERIAKDKKVYYTIVRPYVTYNETRFPYQISPVEYYTIVERIRKGMPVPICGDNQTTVTDARDFAVGMVGLFLNEKAFNQDFHITSDNTTTWKHIAERMASCYGRECTFIDIPKQDLENMWNTIIDIPEILLDKSRPMIFDNSKIKDAVPEYSASRTIDDSIEQIYNCFSKQTNFRINYIWAGCLDRMIKKYVSSNKSGYEFRNIQEKIKYYIGYSGFLCVLYLFVKKIKKLFRG